MCGSPRLIRHPELYRLTVAHLYCDAFYAAIEKRDDPSLADKPVGLIWGVGKTTQARLAHDGIRTIGGLQRLDEAELARRYGSMGLRLARLSHAQDSRSVEPRG